MPNKTTELKTKSSKSLAAKATDPKSLDKREAKVVKQITKKLSPISTKIISAKASSAKEAKKVKKISDDYLIVLFPSVIVQNKEDALEFVKVISKNTTIETIMFDIFHDANSWKFTKKDIEFRIDKFLLKYAHRRIIIFTYITGAMLANYVLKNYSNIEFAYLSSAPYIVNDKQMKNRYLDIAKYINESVKNGVEVNPVFRESASDVKMLAKHISATCVKIRAFFGISELGLVKNQLLINFWTQNDKYVDIIGSQIAMRKATNANNVVKINYYQKLSADEIAKSFFAGSEITNNFIKFVNSNVNKVGIFKPNANLNVITSIAEEIISRHNRTRKHNNEMLLQDPSALVSKNLTLEATDINELVFGKGNVSAPLKAKQTKSRELKK